MHTPRALAPIPARYSLRWRLPFLISGLVALVLATFLWAAYRRVEATLLRTAGERAQVAADLIANLLDGRQATEQLRQLSADPDLRRFLTLRTDDARESVRVRIRALMGTIPRRVEIWDDAGARLLEVAPAATAPGAISKAPPPASAAPSVTGVGALQGSTDGVFSDIVAEIPDDDSAAPETSSTRRLGYVRVRSTFVENPPGLFSRLIGRDAVVRVGNRTGGIWTDFSRVLPAADLDLARPGVTQYRAASGELRLGAVALIPATPWAGWVEFPLADVIAPARRFLTDMIPVALMFVIAAAVLATALAARITTPLSEIVQRRQLWPLASTSRRVASERRDEIGRLGRAFNAMAGDIETTSDGLRKFEDGLKTLNAELEQRVLARTAQLEAANQELEAFSYSVSHDLRAPLRHVQGYVGMVTAATAGQLSDKVQRYLKIITAATVEMGDLIDDLLAFSQIGRARMSEGRVSLDRLVEETIRGLEMATRGRHIVWKVAELPAAIGDPSMLKQVFANLLGNAVKYTGQRDPAEIEIGWAGEKDGQPILFVRDNGAGFDMRYVHRLFAVFQRLHRADEFEGTGIGLATVRRIIARHGGCTWAEGEVDRGATIYFTLKAAPPQNPALESPDELTQAHPDRG